LIHDHPSTSFRHGVLIHESDEDYVDRVEPFLRDGLRAGEPVLAVTTRARGARLREALGADWAQIIYLNCDDHYVRPARTIASYDAIIRRHVADGATSVRAVAEISYCHSEAEWNEWVAYDAIVNRALAPLPSWILCTYDATVTPAAVLDAAVRAHPEVLNGDHTDNPDYSPDQVAAALLPRRRQPLPGLREFDPGAETTTFREGLAAELAAQDVPAAGVIRMVVAANEIVANAWRHAGGPTRARAGLAGSRFVCEVADAGPGVDDPLAGYLPPAAHPAGASGLWVARQLVHRLELLPAAGGGTLARLWL
jgi:anti-sigma regulatory factor (Ser/Thr protein kinase)